MTVPAPRGEAEASVLVPAHNEEAVIGRCLRSLGQGVPPGSLEVVVVCNGCSDRTAAVARAVADETPGSRVTVLELDEGSKILALRAGDAAATVFPRVYLDADVELPGSAVLAVAARLRAGPALAARPPVRYDTAGASWPVRRFYAARSRTPALMSSLWGAGVYALSEAGRARFEAWPDVVGDDLFVDGLFAPTEVEIVRTHPAVVRTPRDTGSLLAILRRAHRGKTQALGSHDAGPPDSVRATLRGLASSATGGPSMAFDAAVYGSLAVAARTPTRRGPAEWERDHSSRRPS